MERFQKCAQEIWQSPREQPCAKDCFYCKQVIGFARNFVGGEMHRKILALTLAMIAVDARADEPDDTSHVSLVCLGAGSANRATSTYAFGATSDGDSGWGQALSQRSVPFDDQVTLELSGDAGRIRMPRSMLPPIRGGKDGWFEVKKVRWSENEITGVVQVSVVNSPKLRVDRLQGMISISGKSGDYSGRCDPFDPETVQRKF